jgi:four helix bundle protein
MPHNPARLEVITRADAVVVDVHRLADRSKRRLSDLSPGIRNQLLRAATSISLNLSEACGYHTAAKTSALLDVAIGSCNEVERLLLLCQTLNAFDQSIDQLIAEIITVRKMTFGFRKRVLAQSPQVPSTPAEFLQPPGAQQPPAPSTPTPTSANRPDSQLHHRP